MFGASAFRRLSLCGWAGLLLAATAADENPAVFTGKPELAKLATAAIVSDATPQARDAGWTGNLAKNPGFEEDYVNVNGEGHVLSFKGGWYYNQQDLVPDYWVFANAAKLLPLAQARPMPTGPALGEGVGRPLDGGQVQFWTWLANQPHAGARSLQLEAGVAVTQQFIRAVSQWGGGAWGGAESRAMPVAAADLPRFNLPWRASVWVRGGGTLNLGGVTAAADAAAKGWQQLSVTLPADKVPAPQVPLTVALVGPGEFDDLVVQEQLPASPNLVPNASFEDAANDYPKGWSPQQKFHAIGPTYYIWTDWNHAFAPIRGGVQLDRLVARSGAQSLRFDVYPGDEKYVESDAITLKQTEPKVVEVGVMVRADRIHLIDVRAVDEHGLWLASYRPRQPEYYKAGQGADGFLFGNGTFGWRYVRKFFFSAAGKPIQALRVRLCARGANGHTLDDAGTRSYDLASGTVWWDDLAVYERTSTADELRARGVTIPAAAAPKAGAWTDAALDFGQRFVGENQFAATLTSSGAGKYALRLTTQLPGGAPAVTESGAVSVKAGQTARLVAPYVVDRLTGDLAQQGTWLVELLGDGKAVARATYAFNTWPVVADLDVSRHYNLPTENPVTTSINLGVAAATLARTARLALELVTPADGKVLQTTTITDLPKAFAATLAALPGAAATDAKKYHHGGGPADQGPEFNLPTPEWTVDRTNLLIVRLDLSKLKVWPHNYPTRDTVLRVRALDAGGQELCRQDSAPFCRMEAPPRQEPIRTVEVRDDGAIMINGQPRYLFGASHQHFRLAHSPARIAQLGLMGHRLPQGGEGKFEALKAMWENLGLYGLQVKPVSGMGGVTPVVDMTPEQRAALEQFVKDGGMQNIVSFNTGGWEATINLADAAGVEKHKALNEWVRKTTGRPVAISTSGAYNAWWLPNFPFYDINHAETEMWGPMDFNVIYVPYMKRAGAKPAWVYLPQLYDNTPYERYRFETYENIIRGSSGVSMIQGIGDPTFNRGLAGELRYLEAPLNSPTVRADVTCEPLVSHKATTYQGKTYILATNAGPVQIGAWRWHTETKQSGAAAHDGDTVNTQWYRPSGIRIHGFRGLAMPELVRAGDKIVQYVWLDPKETPDWAMVCVRGDGRFAHNAVLGAFDWEKFKAQDGNIIMYSELEHSVWHEINWVCDDQIYERAKVLLGQKEADQLKKLADSGREKVAKVAYQAEHFRAAPRPAAGAWHRLELDAAQYGLVGKLVDGFAFLTQNGRALWDYSALERDGKAVRVFCEDTVGIDRALLGAVRVSVPGLKAGTKVRALFEGRELVAADGGFTDSFVGVDSYGDEGGAVVGDMFGFVKDPDRELVRMIPSGYGYTYGPTAVHIYEIQP